MFILPSGTNLLHPETDMSLKLLVSIDKVTQHRKVNQKLIHLIVYRYQTNHFKSNVGPGITS